MIQHDFNPTSKLYELSNEERSRLFCNLIEKYCSITGSEINLTKIKGIVNNLNYWIEGKLSKMHVCHVIKSFEMAIEGEFHTQKVLEAKHIIEWLNKYYSSYKAGFPTELITTRDVELKKADLNRFDDFSKYDSSYGTAVLLRCMYFTGKDRPEIPTIDKVAEYVTKGIDIYSGRQLTEVLSSKRFELKIGQNIRGRL